MDLTHFKKILHAKEPPHNFSNLLKAMWLVANKRWNEAHVIAQEENSLDGSWVHAYLHREEGDIGNASYWYARAGREVPDVTLDREWDEIVLFLLDN